LVGVRVGARKPFLNGLRSRSVELKPASVLAAAFAFHRTADAAEIQGILAHPCGPASRERMVELAWQDAPGAPILLALQSG